MAGLQVIVAGAGIFGVTAALALRERGHAVTLLDPGLAPRPHGGEPANGTLLPAYLPSLAESTDISKVIRLDYGSDLTYLALMEQAMDGWRRWQADWSHDVWTRSGPPIFHETGVMFLSQAPLAPGGFEHESLLALRSRGHAIERLDAGAIHRRFPAWNAERYPDGYYNPQGGYAESGRAVAALLARAEARGVVVRPATGFAGLFLEAGKVAGVVDTAGATLRADRVLVAAGTWTPRLLPDLGADLHSIGQPVFHLAPPDPGPYQAARFPVFGADISRTGWYGFPANREGVVKVANHGVGREVDPMADPREVAAADDAHLRRFLADTFPGLVDAPVVKRRLCVYGDSNDLHFWIAPDPEHPGLVVAAGGSGHGFKFGPVLGGLIADAVEGVENPFLERFRWRTDRRAVVGEEQARSGRTDG